MLKILGKSGLNSTTYFRASKHDEKLWDTFQDPPSDVSSGSIGEETKLLIFLIKLLKVFTYIIVFLVVLASSVLSKITFLLMTSHIKDNTKIRYCDIRSMFLFLKKVIHYLVITNFIFLFA